MAVTGEFRKRAWERIAREEHERRPTAWWLVVLALVAAVGGFAWPTLTGGLVEHQFHQVSTSTSVESWTVGLPLGFRLVRWKSQPPGPQDGFRLFAPH